MSSLVALLFIYVHVIVLIVKLEPTFTFKLPLGGLPSKKEYRFRAFYSFKMVNKVWIVEGENRGFKESIYM